MTRQWRPDDLKSSANEALCAAQRILTHSHSYMYTPMLKITDDMLADQEADTQQTRSVHIQTSCPPVCLSVSFSLYLTHTHSEEKRENGVADRTHTNRHYAKSEARTLSGLYNYNVEFLIRGFKIFFPFSYGCARTPSQTVAQRECDDGGKQ